VRPRAETDVQDKTANASLFRSRFRQAARAARHCEALSMWLIPQFYTVLSATDLD